MAISNETDNLINKALEAWNIEPVQKVPDNILYIVYIQTSF